MYALNKITSELLLMLQNNLPLYFFKLIIVQIFVFLLTIILQNMIPNVLVIYCSFSAI